MPPILQPKNQIPSVSLSHARDYINIAGGRVSANEARDLANRLIQLANLCNVAIFQPSHVFSLWDSTKAPEAFTVEVDNQTLLDLQRVAKIGDSLEKSITELINFYEEKPILNIILLSDALASRESYTNYTNQLAHSVSNAQLHYPFVKVLFDKTTARLGIFCRKNKFTSNSFSKQLALSLHKHRNVFVADKDIPKTYQTNFAMLRQHLKSDFPNLNIVRVPDGINLTVLVDKV